jgi:hypothetical protein
MSFMMTLEINHCELRGEKLEPTRTISVESAGEAKEYIHSMPFSKGHDYYYGFFNDGVKTVLIDPTFNHQYNLQQRFLRRILNVND